MTKIDAISVQHVSQGVDDGPECHADDECIDDGPVHLNAAIGGIGATRSVQCQKGSVLFDHDVDRAAAAAIMNLCQPDTKAKTPDYVGKRRRPDDRAVA